MEEGKMNRYKTYEDYLSKQKEKTTDPERRKKWVGPEWSIKLNGFKEVFATHSHVLNKVKNALALGARTGQEVVALREMGIDAIGLDLVPHEPLVIAGDFHNIPFPDNYFDFVFTNCYDHSLYPKKLALEIERVLKTGGHALIHLHTGRDIDEYSETEVFNIIEVASLFNGSSVTIARPIKKNFASMNYEVLFEKKDVSARNRQILLSIVIATFNRGPVLRQLLDSLKEQTDKNFEVIISIDGSTDDTMEMLEDYKKTSPFELRWINTGLTNTYGLARARNMGIKEAQGEAVVILDDDSFPVPEFVAEHKKSVTENTLTGGARLSTDPTDNLADKMQAYLDTYGDCRPQKFKPVRTYKYVVENNTCMYKKDWLLSGMFDESIVEYGGIGQKFNHELIRRGFKYQFNPRAAIIHQVDYRQNDQYKKMSSKTLPFKLFVKKYLSPLYKLAKKIKNYWEYN